MLCSVLVDLRGPHGTRTEIRLWMPVGPSRDTSLAPVLLCLSSHLSFFQLSGGSERSGLHVLNRCVGIGENIKVKMKGAERKPQAPLLPVEAFTSGSLEGEGIYLHTQVWVCVRERGRGWCSPPPLFSWCDGAAWMGWYVKCEFMLCSGLSVRLCSDDQQTTREIPTITVHLMHVSFQTRDTNVWVRVRSRRTQDLLVRLSLQINREL